MSGVDVNAAVEQATAVKEKLDAAIARCVTLIVANTEHEVRVPHVVVLDIAEALGLASGFMAGLIAAARDRERSDAPS